MVLALLAISAAILFSGVGFIGHSTPGSFGPILSLMVWIGAAGATVVGGMVAGLSSLAGGRGAGILPVVVAMIVLILNLLAAMFLVFGPDV